MRLAAGTFSATVLDVAADAVVAGQVAGALRDAGATIVAPGEEVDVVDGLVVVMSAAAIATPVWWEGAESATARRVVPIRVGSLGAASPPPRIAAINWIDWDPDNPAASFGALITALYADPARHALAQQLAHEAQAWFDAGRPISLLIDDVDHAHQMNDVADEVGADGTSAPHVQEFVQRSLTHSRRRRTVRRRWRGAAAAIALIVGSWAASAVPQLAARSKMNRGSIVAIGAPGLLDQSPEWAAIDAAQLLSDGTSGQKSLGRRTLLQVLQRTWRISEIDLLDSELASVPFDHGRLAATLAVSVSGGSGVGIVDLRAGRLLGTYSLRQRYHDVDAWPDGRIVLRNPGLGILDPHRHGYRVIATHHIVNAWPVRDARLLTTDEHGTATLRDSAGRPLRTFQHRGTVLAASTGELGGRVTALARHGHDIDIIEAATGRTLSRTRLVQATDVGALAPDGLRAAIAGGDGQIWIVGSGRPRPTGIPVSPSATLIWSTGNRLAVLNDGTGAAVISLPGGETLGRLCTSEPQVRFPHQDLAAGVITCDGRGFWALPPGPVTDRHIASRPLPHVLRSPRATVMIDGATLRISVGRSRASGSSINPSNSTITAAAFNRAGDALAVGARNGWVGVIAIGDAARFVANSLVPGHTSVSAVSWSDGRLLAKDASGQIWRVQDCPGCATDAGLIAEAARRLSGCFTSRQLAFSTAAVQRLLRVHRCTPIAKVK